jgi:hypothetical protein
MPAQSKNSDSSLVDQKKSKFTAVLRNGTGVIDGKQTNFIYGDYEPENLDVLARAVRAIRVNDASLLPQPNSEFVSRLLSKQKH